MKKVEIIFYTLVLIIIGAMTFDLVYFSLIGKKATERLTSMLPSNNNETQVVVSGKCSNNPKITDLDKSEELHLKKLAQYQDNCDSFLTNQLMIFTDMPKDSKIAKENAINMAKTLGEFKKYEIKPIVVVEPVSEWGSIDFEEFGTGFYNDWIDDYFKELKAQGITDEMMGTWVPFPEANLPYWNHNNATPEDFSKIVNIYIGTLKEYFPNAKASVLLNSATYESDDFNWINGEYVSLNSYVEGIEDGLIDSFGIQGFPWVSSANDMESRIYDAREFVNSPLAIEAANTLDVKEIWFNTGTFSSKYNNTENKVSVSAQERKLILDGIFKEAEKIKNEGFNISVNIFAQDKSAMEEATNWSYFDGDADEVEHNIIFTEFSKKLEEKEIPLSIFDVVSEN